MNLYSLKVLIYQLKFKIDLFGRSVPERHERKPPTLQGRRGYGSEVKPLFS